MSPGCYLMKNTEGKVIYVGKARKLKNRVSSYFTGAHNYKTTKLVDHIWDFDYIVTGSEKEALLLEINLIKDYTPEYNIMFMDNTYYPYIELTDETHPRLKIVRKTKNKKEKIIFFLVTLIYSTNKQFIYNDDKMANIFKFKYEFYDGYSNKSNKYIIIQTNKKGNIYVNL